MTPATQYVLWAALILSWLLIPLIIVQYRLVVVPRRYQEITDRFPLEPRDPLRVGTPAALLYTKLLKPAATDADAGDFLKNQFWFFHRWNRYLPPLILVAALSGLMLFFSGLWIIEKLSDAPPTAVGRVGTPIVMALWGAFVWSLYEIWSRRMSGDLTPAEVVDVLLRLVIAIPIGYAFSLLVFQTVPSLAAFSVSAFPLRDVRNLLRKQTLQKLGESTTSSATLASKGYLGEILSGIGNQTVVRLEELNIETYLDLAYTDPIRLMVKTGVPIQLVLAWMDEALLAVYTTDKKAKFDAAGMPCALDAQEFYETYAVDQETREEKHEWWKHEAVQQLAKRVDIPCELLPQLLHSIWEDPYVQFLDAAWDGFARPAPPETSTGPAGSRT